jgi:hypothetical protein
MKHIAILALLLAGCAKHAPVPAPLTSGSPLATVAVSPYDIVSPFLCRITTTELSCVATIDVRFRRGQLETQFARGYQLTFRDPKTAKGTGTVFFGCAGANECGPGYFMFASPTVEVMPVEPARFWKGGGDVLHVPHGSLGIAEVDAENNAFTKIRDRWVGSIAPPLLKSGNGVVVSCTDQACTVSVK